MNTDSRILGGLYGSLIGDALGVPVEFAPRARRVEDPVTGMRAHGTHGQPAGTWSDDGALLLCSVESLNEKGFDTEDMGERFVRWSERGHWSAHGVIFDIGIATRQALSRISQGITAEQAGGRDAYDNGNGSLMRILPVGLASLDQPSGEYVVRHLRASSITHGHERSRMACAFFGLMVRSLMEGATGHEALRATRVLFGELFGESQEFSTFRDLMSANLHEWPDAYIRSGGYVMETLTASLWCLLTTSTFAECVLKAVNLGDDTDTTGCVAGGLAGVLYGVEAIPTEWLAALPRQPELQVLYTRFTKATNHS
jgi:ADP-ribosyl-[dinitrogen reductase] hydrolase